MEVKNQEAKMPTPREAGAKKEYKRRQRIKERIQKIKSQRLPFCGSL